MGWCNDVSSQFYNKEIKIKKNIKHEKLYRNDYKYDYFILIKYNYKKTIKNKGSAIFIHLTKNYKPTAGCIAISKKDFLILAKLVNKNTKILIN
jgi:L,D-peptidoglycan transpeptidase YkuD (ErfK/YbiS/YcfS/YnhG family)